MGDVAAEAGEEDDVEEADGGGGAAGYFCGDLGWVCEGGADEVGDSGRGGDGDGEGDLEGAGGDG